MLFAVLYKNSKKQKIDSLETNEKTEYNKEIEKPAEE